ncbi:MAG: peptide deformylase [Candidatus Delongbacteria bacterium]|nr:peptide deformylase [Candidatus Delongbacteria bacterium]
MAVLNILTYGHPLLKKKLQPVEVFNPALEKAAQDMIETMMMYDGIGLAANQVGIDLQMLVIHEKLIDETKDFLIVINPELHTAEGSSRREEGCLSVPNIWSEVVRPQKIELSYQNLKGERIRIEAEDLLARVIQHEKDHLDGVLFVERLPKIKQTLLIPRLKRIHSE